MFDALSVIIKLNMEKVEQNNLINNRIYNRVSSVMRLLVVSELFVAIILGIYISKYISDQLEKVIKFAEDLSDGKLKDFIEVDTKDDFGILAEKLNRAAKNNLGLLEELTLTEEELRVQMDELYTMNEKLTLSEERYRLAIEGANDGIWDVNVCENKIFVSDKFKEIVGINSKGNTYDLDYFLTMIFGNNKDEIANNIRARFREKFLSHSLEFPIITSFGEEKYVLFRSKTVWNSKGEPVHVAGSLTDITDRKKAEKTIENMAYYNDITNLPNRTYAMTILRDIVEKLLHDGEKFALFFLDMDNFKTVNDTFGHAIGDKFLKKASERFKACLRERDIVCHLGGDEFVFLISHNNNIDEINEILDKILNLFKIPFNIEGNEIFYVTASIGISIAPENGEDLETLLKNADTAMYYSKTTGKNKYEFFTSNMQFQFREKLKMKNNLKTALLEEEFTVFYQPKVSVRSGKIIGMEALIRWISPKDGMIPPSEFIPLAEETGLIVPIGEYVIRKVCMQNKAWQESGKKPLRIAVNLSIKQLQRKDIVQTISSILDEIKLDPKWLEIEITESMVMENFERAIGILMELKNMGVRISLDDFGTGYSSLNYLRVLPINAIKIDKSFVDGLHAGSKENFIAATLINLAHGIGMKVIAEGVENSEQVKILKSYDCDQIQGYYFSKPVPAEEFEKLMEKELYESVAEDADF
jgi:diguanylate cyclase (GGDEF)-like protein/PAS domain S-box-containing protein